MKPEFPKPLEGKALVSSPGPKTGPSSPNQAPTPGQKTASAKERRRNPRVKMARPVLVNPHDPFYLEEVQTTVNISKDGYYFITAASHYYMGMNVGVTFPYTPGDPCNMEKQAKVVRIDKLPEGKFGIALQLVLR
jgi:hypothetical protein